MLLKEKLKDKKIILASRSPRRRELLKGAEIEFTLAPDFGVEEVYPADMAVEEVPGYLSAVKSDSYPHRLDRNEILITADTIVICEGVILGKPEDADDACNMLRRLSGRRHRVTTGVTLRDSDKCCIFSVSSDVWFRPITEEEINYYVAKYKPFDKAGSYGIQEWIGYVAIEKIEGSFYNVMGLPIQTLYVELSRFVD